MTASMIPVPLDDHNKTDMLDHGLVELDASAYEEDAGVTWSGILKRLDEKDLLELRYGLLDHWGDPDDDESSEESTGSAIRFLLQMIQHEIGGRWVGWRG
ncbi:MAG: hypothetical protein WD274_13150 [Acidimicrobiia bacterium]